MLKFAKTKPDLRFPEFESEWDEVRVGHYLDEFRGRSSEHNQYQVLTSSNKGLMKQEDYYGENRITDKDNTGFNVIPPGYVTYRSRSDNRTFTFNLNVLGITGVISTYYPVFSIKGGSNRFFVEYFNYHQHYLGRYSVGTSQQVLSLNELREIKLRIPEEAEQQKIAAFLSAVDEKVSQLTRKKELLVEYKRGLMQQIFDQKIRFKNDDGNDFPDWVTAKLSDVCQINPESAELPNTFVYIDLESVESGSLNKETFLQRDQAPSRAQRVLKKGDILFQMVRPYQSNNLIFDREGSFVASTGYAQIRSRIDTRFLFQLLLTYSFVKNVVRRCTGTSYPAINSEDLGEIKIDVPIKREQEKIGEVLTELDKRIGVIAQQIQRTKTFKRGLLQRMFV